MTKRLIAKVSTTINAPSADVWQAAGDARSHQRVHVWHDVTSDWVVGSPIVWKGDWQGRGYEDKGIILQAVPERVLEYSHFSPWRETPTSPRATISSPWNCRPTESGPAWPCPRTTIRRSKRGSTPRATGGRCSRP